MKWDGQGNTYISTFIGGTTEGIHVNEFDVGVTLQKLTKYITDIDININKIYTLNNQSEQSDVREKLELARGIAYMLKFLLVREIERSKKENLLP